MRLYELTNEWLRLRSLDEDEETTAEDLALVQADILQKAQNVGAVLAEMSRTADAIRAEEKRLASKRKAIENRHEYLFEYVKAQMLVMGLEELRGPNFSWKFAKGETKSVVVTDETLIPDEFFRLRREVDKSAIHKASDELGECVPGTAMKVSRSLRIT